jgi:hypothetical protein
MGGRKRFPVHYVINGYRQINHPVGHQRLALGPSDAARASVDSGFHSDEALSCLHFTFTIPLTLPLTVAFYEARYLKVAVSGSATITTAAFELSAPSTLKRHPHPSKDFLNHTAVQLTMADAGDHEAQISQFVGLTGASPQQVRSADIFILLGDILLTYLFQATQYLSATEWNLDAAAAAFFQDQEEGEENEMDTTEARPEPEYTGPRTLDGRPAPQSAFPTSSTASKPQKKKGLATLGSLAAAAGSGHGHSHPHSDGDDDDEDEDEYDDFDERNAPRDLFAGGEKSGLAVQDPAQKGGSKKIINDILAKAKSYVLCSNLSP